MNMSIQILVMIEAVRIQSFCHMTPLAAALATIISSRSAPAAASAPSVFTVMPMAAPLTIGWSGATAV